MGGTRDLYIFMRMYIHVRDAVMHQAHLQHRTNPPRKISNLEHQLGMAKDTDAFVMAEHFLDTSPYDESILNKQTARVEGQGKKKREVLR